MELYNYIHDNNAWVDPMGLAGIPSYNALKNLAQNVLYFSTTKNGAVFWSGEPNMSIAQEWAANRGKTTLEQTVGGKYLASLELFDNIPGKQAAEIWDIASKRFAQGATGNINVFSTGTSRIGKYGERTWWRLEKPNLTKNVNKIIRRRKDGKRVGVGCKSS